MEDGCNRTRLCRSAAKAVLMLIVVDGRLTSEAEREMLLANKAGPTGEGLNGLITDLHLCITTTESAKLDISASLSFVRVRYCPVLIQWHRHIKQSNRKEKMGYVLRDSRKELSSSRVLSNSNSVYQARRRVRGDIGRGASLKGARVGTISR